MIHPKQIKAYNLARQEIGTVEIKGERDNPEIVGWFADVGHSWVQDDETAWCAAFVGAMLEAAGLNSTKALNARSYLEWGEEVPLRSAQPGDIVVYWRESPESWKGHVGFYVDQAGETIITLGGNQRNEVNETPYDTDKLLSVRRIHGPGPKPKRPGFKSPVTDGEQSQGWLAKIVSMIGNLFGRRKS